MAVVMSLLAAVCSGNTLTEKNVTTMFSQSEKVQRYHKDNRKYFAMSERARQTFKMLIIWSLEITDYLEEVQSTGMVSNFNGNIM